MKTTILLVALFLAACSGGSSDDPLQPTGAISAPAPVESVAAPPAPPSEPAPTPTPVETAPPAPIPAPPPGPVAVPIQPTPPVVTPPPTPVPTAPEPSPPLPVTPPVPLPVQPPTPAPAPEPEPSPLVTYEGIGIVQNVFDPYKMATFAVKNDEFRFRATVDTSTPITTESRYECAVKDLAIWVDGGSLPLAPIPCDRHNYVSAVNGSVDGLDIGLQWKQSDGKTYWFVMALGDPDGVMLESSEIPTEIDFSDANVAQTRLTIFDGPQWQREAEVNVIPEGLEMEPLSTPSSLCAGFVYCE